MCSLFLNSILISNWYKESENKEQVSHVRHQECCIESVKSFPSVASTPASAALCAVSLHHRKGALLQQAVHQDPKKICCKAVFKPLNSYHILWTQLV